MAARRLERSLERERPLADLHRVAGLRAGGAEGIAELLLGERSRLGPGHAKRAVAAEDPVRPAARRLRAVYEKVRELVLGRGGGGRLSGSLRGREERLPQLAQSGSGRGLDRHDAHHPQGRGIAQAHPERKDDKGRTARLDHTPCAGTQEEGDQQPAPGARAGGEQAAQRGPDPQGGVPRTLRRGWFAHPEHPEPGQEPGPEGHEHEGRSATHALKE